MSLLDKTIKCCSLLWELLPDYCILYPWKTTLPSILCVPVGNDRSCFCFGTIRYEAPYWHYCRCLLLDKSTHFSQVKYTQEENFSVIQCMWFLHLILPIRFPNAFTSLNCYQCNQLHPCFMTLDNTSYCLCFSFCMLYLSSCISLAFLFAFHPWIMPLNHFKWLMAILI